MTQKYIKSTQELCDKMYEESNKYDNDYYQITSWECSECGWNISYAEACVITNTHDYWRTKLNHYDGNAGIYHAWCRKLCSWCGNRIGKEGHAQCASAIKERETEKRISSADDEMYNNLLEVK